MAERRSHWLCGNSFALRCPDRGLRLLARLLGGLDRCLGGRLPHTVWVRYELDLSPVGDRPEAAEVSLAAIDDALIDAFKAHPWRDHPQLRTAIRLWEQGLRRGYVWREAGEPLCVQWLFTADDSRRLRRLPNWSGLYPPLPPACGQVENIVVLPKGLRRRGGAATPFAYAVYQRARVLGLRRLITHIKEDNTAARRWADRSGWRPCGSIRRYRLKLPLLGGGRLYLHSDLPARAAPQVPRPAAAPEPAAYNQPLRLK